MILARSLPDEAGASHRYRAPAATGFGMARNEKGRHLPGGHIGNSVADRCRSTGHALFIESSQSQRQASE